MGLQQILMVVLGVIIVGVAISLGVVMFSGQAYRSNRTALISEINDFATLAFQYWKLPASMGGAGQNPDNIDPAFLASYLGFSESYGKVVSIEYKLQSENGTYKIDSVVESTITIKALGTETKGEKHPYIVSEINMLESTIKNTVSDAADFD